MATPFGDYYSYLGQSSLNESPKYIQGLSGKEIVDIACTNTASCALDNKGEVYFFGTFGTFFLNVPFKAVKSPTKVELPVFEGIKEKDEIVSIHSTFGSFYLVSKLG